MNPRKKKERRVCGRLEIRKWKRRDTERKKRKEREKEKKEGGKERKGESFIADCLGKKRFTTE